MVRLGSVFFSGLALLIFAAAIQAQPSLKLNLDTRDFGKVAPFEKLRHDIVVTNIGDQLLEIINVGTTCGCTAAVPSATGIPAGATSIVSVTMTASSSTTRMNKQVKIITNDPKQKEVRVTLIADVRNLWTFSPASMMKFDDVPYKAERSETLYLSNNEGAPFKVLEVQTDRPEFRAEAGEPTDNGTPITVYFNSGKKRELITASIEIITDHPQQPRAHARITASITGYIKFTPSSLYFGRSPAGKTVDRELRLALTDKSKADIFEITNIKSGDEVKAEVIGKNALGQLRVKVSYQVPQSPGYHRGEITLETNLEDEPTVTVPYSVLVPRSGS
ncbi:MAG: DUF1573 domain-containing protein [Candidatus Hinthialibacter antarcticus]|nr:DUF1573 domain-containing protein [Candidatus Hinthialibacter antarcticus]